MKIKGRRLFIKISEFTDLVDDKKVQIMKTKIIS